MNPSNPSPKPAWKKKAERIEFLIKLLGRFEIDSSLTMPEIAKIFYQLGFQVEPKIVPIEPTFVYLNKRTAELSVNHNAMCALTYELLGQPPDHKKPEFDSFNEAYLDLQRQLAKSEQHREQLVSAAEETMRLYNELLTELKEMNENCISLGLHESRMQALEKRNERPKPDDYLELAMANKDLREELAGAKNNLNYLDAQLYSSESKNLKLREAIKKAIYNDDYGSVDCEKPMDILRKVLADDAP